MVRQRPALVQLQRKIHQHPDAKTIPAPPTRREQKEQARLTAAATTRNRIHRNIQTQTRALSLSLSLTLFLCLALSVWKGSGIPRWRQCRHGRLLNPRRRVSGEKERGREREICERARRSRKRSFLLCRPLSGTQTVYAGDEA